MIVFTPRMWTSLGLSAIALVGVSACGQGEGGEAGLKAGVATSDKAGEGEGKGAKTVEAAAPAVASAGSSAGSSAGGEAGEAGAATAYADIPPASQLGLRIAHVQGFLLVARKAYDDGQLEEASVLVSQGLLEVYAPHAGTLDTGAKGLKAALDNVVAVIDGKKPKTEVEAAFSAAETLVGQLQVASGGAPGDIVAGMLSIAAGLYKGVVTPTGNDPIEYQHAYGAALSAKAAFETSKSTLSAKNGARTETLGKDIEALLALFPSTTIPETPASVAAVTGATSRGQLALSGIK